MRSPSSSGHKVFARNGRSCSNRNLKALMCSGVGGWNSRNLQSKLFTAAFTKADIPRFEPMDVKIPVSSAFKCIRNVRACTSAFSTSSWKS